MGYLNNQVVTVDAILTKKGRELLAKGDGSFNITQFALADDEIDYTLYNPNHPSGSAFYGEAIENMPLLEAFPDETQMMKYKLTTLTRGTAKMPIIEVSFTNLSLTQGGHENLSPQTLNFNGNTSAIESSYTFTISDVRAFSTFNGSGGTNTEQQTSMNASETFGTNVSKTVIGTTLNMTATSVPALFNSNETIFTTLIIEGRDSRARIQIPVQINKSK